MLSKDTETFAVIISSTPSKRGFYNIQIADAVGEVYDLIVHEEIIVDYRLVVGKEIDEETFHNIQNITEYQQAYSYAIGILARRMYTEKEIKRKLYGRKTPDDVIDAVVEKLKNIQLLNDLTYATLYIENQVKNGKKSRRKIISDLMAKGVNSTIIDEVSDLFNGYSEVSLIQTEIEEAYRQYERQQLSDFDLARKITQKLARKGFDIYEVQRQYGFFLEDLEAEATEF